MSIFEPDFSNPLHNSVLALDMPEESRLVSYIEDVAGFVPGRTAEKQT